MNTYNKQQLYVLISYYLVIYAVQQNNIHKMHTSLNVKYLETLFWKKHVCFGINPVLYLENRSYANLNRENVIHISVRDDVLLSVEIMDKNMLKKETKKTDEYNNES